MYPIRYAYDGSLRWIGEQTERSAVGVVVRAVDLASRNKIEPLPEEKRDTFLDCSSQSCDTDEIRLIIPSLAAQRIPSYFVTHISRYLIFCAWLFSSLFRRAAVPTVNTFRSLIQRGAAGGILLKGETNPTHAWIYL